MLWVKLSPCTESVTVPAVNKTKTLETPENYKRDFVWTFYTLPEWWIVYSAGDLAQTLETQKPSDFPYFKSIFRFWGNYKNITCTVKKNYELEPSADLVLIVIGGSYTAEMTFKGVYENTIGWLFEWFSISTPEDKLNAQMNRHYYEFLHQVPWYAFPYGDYFMKLWNSETGFLTGNWLRKYERKIALSIDYGTKLLYGKVIGWASGATYGAQDQTIGLWVSAIPEGEAVTVIESRPEEDAYFIEVARYEAFTQSVLSWMDQAVDIYSIAGNNLIFVSVISPIQNPEVQSTTILNKPLVVEASQYRIGLAVPTATLMEELRSLAAQGVTIEHIYDY